MKNRRAVLFALIYLLSANSYAQTDSVYTYEYECDGCGSFETYSSIPIEIETEAVADVEVMPDAGENAQVVFTNMLSRKGKTVVEKYGVNRFNVYPNPARDGFYLNFETDEATVATLALCNVLGAELWRKEVVLKKGMNVIEEMRNGLASGHYFLKANLHDRFFSRKLFFTDLK